MPPKRKKTMPRRPPSKKNPPKKKKPARALGRRAAQRVLAGGKGLAAQTGAGSRRSEGRRFGRRSAEDVLSGAERALGIARKVNRVGSKRKRRKR
jgi:hypothetical protein